MTTSEGETFKEMEFGKEMLPSSSGFPNTIVAFYKQNLFALFCESTCLCAGLGFFLQIASSFISNGVLVCEEVSAEAEKADAGVTDEV